MDVTLTLDDYPLAATSRGRACDPIWRAIANALEVRRVPAAWFVVAAAVDDRAARFLDSLAAGGADVGNHTAHHLALTDVTEQDFLRDVDEADRILQRWMSPPKLFRYPFLREGESTAKQACVRAGLEARGYVNVRASVAPRDWEFDAVPLDAAVIREYMAHVEEQLQLASQRARERLGRDIPHILVLHVNALNAAALETLLATLSRTCRFIPLRDALPDVVYRRAIPPLKRGLTLLEAI